MSFKDVCIPLIIGVLGFALPLLINIVQHIGEKYRSTRLMQLFASEKWVRLFIYSLIVSLVVLLGYLFVCCPCALVLFMIGACVMLVFSVLKVFRLIYIYQVPAFLQHRLLDSSVMTPERRQAWLEVFYALLERDNNEEVEKGFKALGKWSKDSIVKNDSPTCFQTYRRELYDAFITIHGKLCELAKRVIPIPSGTRLLSVFFDNTVDCNGNRLLSDETLHTLWICLHQQLDYNRDDWFMGYWRRAHQYYDGHFVSDNPCDDEKTKEEIEKAKKDFKEFHLALGGLLLYKKKYDLLQKVTTYSDESPARYHLVPEICGELLGFFMELLSTAPEGRVKYALNYPFFNLNSGIADDNAFINSWIQKYLVFLLYRHFTGQYAHPNAGEEQSFCVPEDESSWRALSPILWKRMNDSELQTISAQILGISEEEMTKAKQRFQDEINRINKTVAQQP